MEAPPSQTVYVNNLNEKVKLDELKKSLYHVFSQFGNILEINANKRLKMRGQAWIVYDDLGGATKAFREMQGFNFYGKPMRVSFARGKSDVVAKADGSFVARPKRKLEDKKDKKKSKNAKPAKKIKEEGAAAAPSSAAPGAAAAAGYTPPAAMMEPPAPPHKILFVENLPPQTNAMMLSMLFQQYPGYKEARLVPGKPGIAFTEFDDAFHAGQAKEALQGFKITPTNLMKISFAKQ